MKLEVVEWVFDALPPSGARRGGDPASHVFESNLRTFVREVVQNASDQASVDGAPQVHFRFYELVGTELIEFLDAVGWPTLRPHLDSASRSRGGRGIKQALDDLDQRKKLLLLVIEDRETVGLTGDELEGESHFRALCKDTLYSHKQSEGSGGSYGLGKSVLWGFSGLSTVLFNSQLPDEEKHHESPRLIGRAELPTHTIESRPPKSYAGSGWFGRKVGKTEVHAESVWSTQASEIAVRLRLARTDPDATGTSILVLGFRDPTADGERSIVDIETDIRAAIEREFWPATVMPRRPLVTWVAAGGEGRRVLARDFTLASPFVECYRQRESQTAALLTAGDVVVKDIEIDVPARRDGSAAAVKGRVRLCVRLSGDDERRPLRVAAPLIHRALPLTRREAALPGVWRFLALVHSPELVRHRWEDRSWATTRTRYWNLGTRPDSNAFYRLWWIAELTRDGDSYALTESVFDRQPLATQIFIRHFSHYRPAVAAFVEVMREASSPDIERVAKELYGRLSTLVLESMDAAALQTLIRELAP